MQYNREIINKADLALADFAPGGILVPKQAAKFIKIAIKKNKLTSMVRVVPMSNPTEEHPKMIWTGRVMHPGVESTALTQAQRSKPTFDKMELVTKLGKAEAHMSRETLEDQIERGTFRNTIITFLGEKAAGDFEDRLIQGDTLSTDPWLADQDGMLKLITSNVVLGGAASLSAAMLDDVMQVLPEEFDDQPGLKFFTNRKARSAYRRSWISAHPDSIGALTVTGGNRGDIGYEDVALEKVPRFPNSLGAGTNETNVAYLDPKNMVMGMYRKVTLDTEFRPSEQVWVVVLTIRMALQLEHEPAAAKVTGVLGK